MTHDEAVLRDLPLRLEGRGHLAGAGLPGLLRDHPALEELLQRGQPVLHQHLVGVLALR